MRLRWLGGFLLLSAAACGGDSGEGIDNPFGTGATGGGAAAGTQAGGTFAGTGATPGGTGTSTGTVTGSAGGALSGTAVGGNTAGASAGGTTAGTGTGTGTGGSLPCDVAAILKDKCQTCHGSPLMSGPMPLITWADLQANSTAKPGQTIAARVKARINDTASPMPPTGRPALTAAEKQTLLAYIDGGAKPTTANCSTGGGTTAGGATAGGTTSGGTTSGGATGGGGIGTYLPPDSECDYIQELRAHAGQTPGDTTPYEAPTGGDSYEQFFFKPKWTEKVHTIRIDPIIDNGAVLHHWLLYMQSSTSGDGTHASDTGLQSGDSQLLSGWAPGNMSIPLGRDIGLQTINATNGRFGIELHYNTSANPANRKDRSGARLCVTKNLRPKEAAVHWLGTQAIVGWGKFDAVGTCNVPKEAHVIAHSPHMHKTGRYMKTIVTRKGGGTATITDKPFAFTDQQIYPVDAPTGEVVVQPGDVITTTCSYDSDIPITFGPGTADEMCYNFVVAWPAGSLSSGTGIVGGKNTCIEGI